LPPSDSGNFLSPISNFSHFIAQRNKKNLWYWNKIARNIHFPKKSILTHKELPCPYAIANCWLPQQPCITDCP